MSEIISLKNVSKSYAKKVIFSDVNMSIVPGQPTVIMGANGCGKSTLLKIIAGVLSHTSGEVIRSPKIKISFAPDRFPKLPFKVSDYLSHMGKINGMSGEEINNYIDTQFEYLGIPKHIKHQKIAKCSKGTIQKINIMQSLLAKTDMHGVRCCPNNFGQHQATSLLIMDEPFSGLDENSIEQLIKLLTSMQQTAVIISCHEKTLAQRISDNIFVFDEQSVLARAFRTDQFPDRRQSLVRSVDVSSHMCIKFFPTRKWLSPLSNRMQVEIAEQFPTGRANSELCEVLIEKDKLNEALLLLMEKGHEIHSVNPGR